MTDDHSFKATFDTLVREIHNNPEYNIPPVDYLPEKIVVSERLINLTESVEKSGL